MSGGGFWQHRHPLILASQSATRRLLLESAGLAPRCIPAEVDERALEAKVATASATAVAEALASAKAGEVAARFADHIVIGADQVLVHAGQLLHKPKDAAGAKAQLLALSGHTHTLISAVAVYGGDQQRFVTSSAARLTMRTFGPRFVDLYLEAAGDDVTRSVGAYQVEGLGIHLFEKIEGDQATILGLPLLPLLAHLRHVGFLAS